jgi:hypothetical protein
MRLTSNRRGRASAEIILEFVMVERLSAQWRSGRTRFVEGRAGSTRVLSGPTRCGKLEGVGGLDRENRATSNPMQIGEVEEYRRMARQVMIH